jgi:hypothetical protein
MEYTHSRGLEMVELHSEIICPICKCIVTRKKDKQNNDYGNCGMCGITFYGGIWIKDEQ